MARASRVVMVVSLAAVAACGSKAKQQAPAAGARETAAASAPGGKPACPHDGSWSECTVLERLQRSGLVAQRDSSAAEEKGLAQRGMLIHLGSASLEVFLFPDSAARKAAEKGLDTTQFVGYMDPQGIRAERSLIRSANLLALLDSKRDVQRQRVGDALTAGPPQKSDR